MKNLKVCIELTGLRLSKPRQLQNLQELWDRQGALSRDKACPSVPVSLRREPQPNLCTPASGPCLERSGRTDGEEDKGWGYSGVDAGKEPCASGVLRWSVLMSVVSD